MPTGSGTDAKVAEVTDAYRQRNRRKSGRGNGLPTDIGTDALVAEAMDAYRQRNKRTSSRGNRCQQTSEQTH